MPAVKNAARKATKKTAKKATKRSAQRTLSAAHKRALAEGRTMSATVDRYLSAVNTPKQRGRKVSKATLTQRLAAAPSAPSRRPASRRFSRRRTSATFAGAHGNQRRRRHRHQESRGGVRSHCEEVRRERGIGYGAWRDAGVPAVVLKRAGVRGNGGGPPERDPRPQSSASACATSPSEVTRARESARFGDEGCSRCGG